MLKLAPASRKELYTLASTVVGEYKPAKPVEICIVYVGVLEACAYRLWGYKLYFFDLGRGLNP